MLAQVAEHVLSMGLLFLILHRLTAGARPPSAPLASESSDRAVTPRSYAPVVAGLTVLLVVAGVMQLAAFDRLAVPGQATPGFLPSTLVDWEFSAAPAGWSADAQQQTRSTRASYRLGGRAMQAVVVETLSPTAKLPRSASPSGEPGEWREQRVQQQEVCAATGCIKLRHTSWRANQGDVLRHAYDTCQVGSFNTTSDLALRAMHGWLRLTGRQQRLRLLGLICEGDIAPSDELARLFQALQAAVAADAR